MKKLLSLLLAAFILVGCSFKPSPSFESPNQLLQYLRSVASLSIEVPGTSSYQPVCSTMSINEGKKYWLTAAHCVVGVGEKFFILGDDAYPVLIDATNDLAILKTQKVSLPGRALAKSAPTYGDKIILIGYPGPLEMKEASFAFGWVSHPKLKLMDNPWDPFLNHPFMVIQTAAAPGNSGSGILNSRGEVVSVLQASWGRGFSSMSLSAPFENITVYKQYWTEK